MVLAFVTAVIDPVLSNIHFAGPEITFNELWSVFLTVCALMFFCWKAPHLAASLLGGSPHLGAGDLLQAASTPIAAGMALGAVGGRALSGVSATRAAASAGQGAARPASPLSSAASSLGASGRPAERAGGGGSPPAAPTPSSGGGASASLVQSAMGTTAHAPSPGSGGVAAPMATALPKARESAQTKETAA
jgi:type IV secretion system protein TrbL